VRRRKDEEGVIVRPDPPAELTEEQAKEWREVVDALPANWFPRETHVLLINLCRLTCRQRLLDSTINEMEKDPEVRKTQAYRDMIKEDREILKMIGQVSSKMRLTQLSTHSQHDTKGRGTKGNRGFKVVRPWDDDDDDDVEDEGRGSRDGRREAADA